MRNMPNVISVRISIDFIGGRILKKQTIIRMIIAILLVLIMAGCDNNAGATDESTASGNYTVYGGSVGGIWSIFTEGVSEAFRKEYPGTKISAVPGTVAGNPVLVNQQKADFAISESLTAAFAYEGRAPFDETSEDIRAVAAIMPINTFQLVARESADFDSIEDVVQNESVIRYSAGEKDALGDIVSEAIFAAYDTTYDDIESYGGVINFLSGGKSFELMGDARIDALGKMVPIPASDILEASTTIDLKLIPIGETAIDYLVDEFSVTPYTIEAGSYDFQTEDYDTINSPTILITHADMDDDVVYQMVESIYNQLDYLYSVHNGFKNIDDETITDVGKIPFHPAAEQFFQEKGLLDE